MTCITIKHNKDLTNELKELYAKVEAARRARKQGILYTKPSDWGKFIYTNVAAVDYANTHFVHKNREEEVAYFPIQPKNICHDIKNNRLRIKCLGIDEPFISPPRFIRIRFIHVFYNYILIEYIEANDYDELKQLMIDGVIEVISYMKERNDDMTDELRALAVYKTRYIKRILMDEMTPKGKQKRALKRNLKSSTD